jgi:indole-3-acetaldehyde oxidase
MLIFSCPGEAVYVDDIPAPKDCLYGVFIYSTHPHAHIKSINFRPPLASRKVITVITSKDIPAGGKDIGSRFPMLGEEALFGDPVCEFTGQNIGVVVPDPKPFELNFRQIYKQQHSISFCAEF